ncbi:hypothetical protein GQ42DRAFT_165620 [Ramicandelaber brevisporus]|nr:hypothetical protein GQ42DRAFT_165620 [Ramicandelaber brevisporus]
MARRIMPTAAMFSRRVFHPTQYRRLSTTTSTLNRTPLFTELRERGFIADVTSPNIEPVLNSSTDPVTIYCGLDPTAPSLHVGNLLPLLCLLHMHAHGHKVLALVGGATGGVGDPSGRSSERVALGSDVLARNISRIDAQIRQFFERGESHLAKYYHRQSQLSHSSNDVAVQRTPVQVINNADWTRNLSLLDFLSGPGKHARVNAMIARESVKARLSSAQGISFTEFAYQLLQAYDFWHLYHKHGCRVQIGGSDQWGNITAGTQLIQKYRPNEGKQSPVADNESDNGKDDSDAFGLTIPLLTTSSGEKFGKSAGNAVWLDASMTTPFELYQFFLKVTDIDAARYLKVFTFLPLEEIETIAANHTKNPEKRIAQTALAAHVTELLHGEEGLRSAQVATEVLFENAENNGGSVKATAEEIVQCFKDDPRLVSVPREQVVGKRVVDASVLAGACKSKSAAGRLVSSGGLYVRNARVASVEQLVQEADLIDNAVLVMRTGKSSYHLVHLV